MESLFDDPEAPDPADRDDAPDRLSLIRARAGRVLTPAQRAELDPCRDEKCHRPGLHARHIEPAPPAKEDKKMGAVSKEEAAKRLARAAELADEPGAGKQLAEEFGVSESATYQWLKKARANRTKPAVSPPKPARRATRPPPVSPAPLRRVTSEPKKHLVELMPIRHTFQLRRDVPVSVELPEDLTTADVERLYRWLQTLPLES